MHRVAVPSYVQIKNTSIMFDAVDYAEVSMHGLEDPIESLQRSIDQWRSSKVLDCRKILHENIVAFVQSARSVDVNVFEQHRIPS